MISVSGKMENVKATGWTDCLQFYVLFNSISVILGRLESDNESDNERLYAVEPLLRLKKFPPPVRN